MFGPQVFLRLFVRMNQDVWPWLLLAVVAGFVVPFLLVSQRLGARRLALWLISAGWIASGYGFLVGYFGPVNWPAAWFGWGFVAQGLGLIAMSGAIDYPPHQPRTATSRLSSLVVIWIAGVLVMPWWTVAEAGNWRALGLFGLSPWTTAAISMLAVVVLPRSWCWVYLILPILWSLFSAATFWELGTYWLLAFPLATLAFIGLGFWSSPRRAQNQG